MKVVTFKLPEELLRRLDSYAMQHGLSRSDVIRRAIMNLIEGQQRKKFIIRRVVLT